MKDGETFISLGTYESAHPLFSSLCILCLPWMRPAGWLCIGGCLESSDLVKLAQCRLGAHLCKTQAHTLDCGTSVEGLLTSPDTVRDAGQRTKHIPAVVPTFAAGKSAHVLGAPQ